MLFQIQDISLQDCQEFSDKHAKTYWNEINKNTIRNANFTFSFYRYSDAPQIRHISES